MHAKMNNIIDLWSLICAKIPTLVYRIQSLQFSPRNSVLAIQSLQFSPCNPVLAIQSLHSVLAIQSLQFSPCNSVLAIQSLQFSPCNSVLAIQFLQFSPCNSVTAIYAVLAMQLSACNSDDPYHSDDVLKYCSYLAYTTINTA